MEVTADAMLASSFRVSGDSIWATALSETASVWAIHSRILTASERSLEPDDDGSVD